MHVQRDGSTCLVGCWCGTIRRRPLVVTSQDATQWATLPDLDFHVELRNRCREHSKVGRGRRPACPRRVRAWLPSRPEPYEELRRLLKDARLGATRHGAELAEACLVTTSWCCWGERPRRHFPKVSASGSSLIWARQPRTASLCPHCRYAHSCLATGTPPPGLQRKVRWGPLGWRTWWMMETWVSATCSPAQERETSWTART